MKYVIEAVPVLALCFDSQRVAFGYENGQSFVSDVEKGVFFRLQKHQSEVVQIV